MEQLLSGLYFSFGFLWPLSARRQQSSLSKQRFWPWSSLLWCLWQAFDVAQAHPCLQQKQSCLGWIGFPIYLPEIVSRVAALLLAEKKMGSSEDVELSKAEGGKKGERVKRTRIHKRSILHLGSKPYPEFYLDVSFYIVYHHIYSVVIYISIYIVLSLYIKLLSTVATSILF